MIQVLFGDDEHTAAEGPYVRMLKARKWLLAGAAVAILHTYGLLNLKAITKLSGELVTLPDWLLTAGLATGLAYLLLQYGALLVQLWGSYKTLIERRLPDSESTKQLKQDILQLESKINEYQNDLEENFLDYQDQHATQLNIEQMKDKKEYSESKLRYSLREDPTARPYFRISELLIDSGRAAMPFIVAASTLVRLAILHPGF